LKTSFRFQAVTLALLSVSVSAFADPTTVIGPLEDQVSETYRLGDSLDSCDLTATQKSIRLNLARALDDREQEISDFLRASARTNQMAFSGTTAELDIGPLNLVSRANAPKLSAEKKPKSNGWVSYTSGWDDYDQEYQDIKSQRVNARWIRLLGLVRATISDDYRRGTYGTWMGVSAEGIDESSELVKRIGACLKEKKCDDLQKSDAFKNALNLTPEGASDFGAYRKAVADEAKVRALKNLLADVEPYTDYFEPVKQKGVRMTDGKVITLSLDSGDMRGHETEFGKVIEKFWKLGENAIKIEWMTSTRDEPIFKWFLVPTPKSANLMDYVHRTISISQNSVESIPAHLAGRALGFRARTFAVWHPDTCKYEDQSKPDDLLSDGRLGSVTAAHWDSLKKVYAPKP
jgi:hypothetical protein